jgi:hypothetical protein
MKIADIQPEETHGSVAVDELQIVRLKKPGQQDANDPLAGATTAMVFRVCGGAAGSGPTETSD